MTDREVELERQLRLALGWLEFKSDHPNIINHNYFLFLSETRKLLEGLNNEG